MPSIRDLDRFRRSFLAIGGENEKTEEPREDLALPKGEGLDDDLASLLNIDPNASFGKGASAADTKPDTTTGGLFGQNEYGQAEAAAAPSDPSSGELDFSAFLDSIPLDDDSLPPPEDAVKDETLAPSSADSLPDGAYEEFVIPSTSDLSNSGLSEAPNKAETFPTEDDDFSVPQELLSGFANEIEDASSKTDKAFDADGLKLDTEAPEASVSGDGDMDSFDLESFTDFEQSTEDYPPSETEELSEPAAVDYTDKLSGIPEGEKTVPASGFSDEFDLPEGFDFSLHDEISGEEKLSAEGSEPEERPAEAAAPSGEAADQDNAFQAGAFNLGDDFSNGDLPEDSLDALPEEEAFDLSVLEFGDIPTAAEREATLPERAPEARSTVDFSGLDEELKAAGYGPSPKKSETNDDIDVDNLENFALAGIDDSFGAGAKIQDLESLALPGAEAVEEIILTDDDFESLQETLSSYPLNLRVACEELIAEHAVPPDQMAAFVKDLVRGLGATAMAQTASRLIGREIVIPKGFEKLSGEELEGAKASFGYIFVHRILPPLRVFAFVALAAASLIYLSLEFVYRPIRANGYYKQGYELIPAGEYTRANERFDQGFKLWRMKTWFYRYAEAFADADQYLFAEEKYDQLLNWYPRDKKGSLDYAAMELYELSNYEKADSIIRRNILDFAPDDREGLLALGDANLEWGAINPERYEEARKAFARLIGVYGNRDEYLERMLKYFIRTDKLGEVIPLQAHFLASDRRRISGASLAELGGYLMDKKTNPVIGIPDPLIATIIDIKQTLVKAIQEDPSLPEAYYHLSRYYERYGSPLEELQAAERALDAYAAVKRGTARRDAEHVDCYRRVASLYRDMKEFILAESKLDEGIQLYEDRKARGVLSPSPLHGRLYADRGDIAYFLAGDFSAAMDDYTKAELDGWSPPELRYRMGYIHYRAEEWGLATARFFSAASDLPLNRRILFSLGNASYLRGDLWVAQGYFERLLEVLENKRSRFPTLLPAERPEHNELAERFMRARNNMGVVYGALADATGSVSYKAQAFAHFTESARAWDSLTRDPETLTRSLTVNLAYLNIRNVLRPENGYEPQIYRELDKDVSEPSSWEELLD